MADRPSQNGQAIYPYSDSNSANHSSSAVANDSPAVSRARFQEQPVITTRNPSLTRQHHQRPPPLQLHSSSNDIPAGITTSSTASRHSSHTHIRQRSSGSDTAKSRNSRKLRLPPGDASVKLSIGPSPPTSPRSPCTPSHYPQPRIQFTPSSEKHNKQFDWDSKAPEKRLTASHPSSSTSAHDPPTWLDWAKSIIMLSPRIPFASADEDTWGNSTSRLTHRSPRIGVIPSADDSGVFPSFSDSLSSAPGQGQKAKQQYLTTGDEHIAAAAAAAIAARDARTQQRQQHQRGGSAPQAILNGLLSPQLGLKSSGAASFLSPFLARAAGRIPGSPVLKSRRQFYSADKQREKDSEAFLRSPSLRSPASLTTSASSAVTFFANVLFLPFAFVRLLLRRSKLFLAILFLVIGVVYALGATRKSSMQVLNSMREIRAVHGLTDLNWSHLSSGSGAGVDIGVGVSGLQRFFPGVPSRRKQQYGSFDVSSHDRARSNVTGAVGPAANRFKSWEGGRVDGRLLLKAGEKHPIPMLMARAKQRWQHLNERQSKTFADAVQEYKDRYGRSPPKGFDKWYAFARYHNVKLIDEFNIIEDDFRLFRAFSGPEFRARVRKMGEITDFAWQISVKDGKATSSGELENHDRAHGVLHLLRQYVADLPDLEIVYNGHDTARVNVGWEERERLDRLVQHGQYQTFNESDTEMKPHEKSVEPGWGMKTICPPSSASRKPGFDNGYPSRDWTGTEMPTTPSGSIGTLVDSFYQHMDICENPQYRHYHSASSYVFPWHPTVTMPLFTAGVQGNFGDIHCIITEQFGMESRYDPTWDERPFDRLVWRGQTSGPFFDKYSAWKSSHRARLHILSHQEKGSRNITITDKKDVMRTVEVPNVQLNPLFLDTGFVGPAVQCSKEDGTCDEMTKVFNGYEPRLSFERASLYKYVGDFDGNSWSGRFQRLMSSNAAVVKATIYREFWTDWAVPWLHFIPVSVDYSDLWDVMAFFRGGPRGEGAHDELGREIALAGKAWARDHFRYQDMEVFTFRQYLEYGRLWADDRAAMSYDGPVEGYEPVWTPTQNQLVAQGP